MKTVFSPVFLAASVVSRDHNSGWFRPRCLAFSLALSLTVSLALSLAGCGTDATPPAATDGGAIDGGVIDGAGSGTGDTANTVNADTVNADTGAVDTHVGVDTVEDGYTPPDTSGPASKYNGFDAALLLTGGSDPVKETLSPTGESDYFTFEGKKGAAMVISIIAQKTPFDVEAIDTVITVYDADKKQIAANDDPSPRNTNDSSLYLMLPKDGTYYVVVQECWTWLAANNIKGSCAEPKNKSKTGYAIFIGTLNDSLNWVVKDAEKGDTAADATTIGYTKNDAGTAYNMDRIFGTFTGVSDIDWFKFVMPTDITTTGSRLQGSFTPLAAGVDGNGSTTTLGLAEISLASAPTAVVASVDLANKNTALGVPLKAGETYLLSVRHPGKTAGSNDFYFLNHRASSDNPLEAADTSNNALKTPETMQSGQGSVANGTYYFVTGDIAPITDVDHFGIAVPTGMEGGKITVACSAQRAGSGLRGFEMTLMKEDGTKISGGATIESADIGSVLSQVAIGGLKGLVLQLKAAKQDAAVSSSFYRCGVQITK